MLLKTHRKEKWTGSQGEEVLSSITSNIPTGTKELITDAQKRLFNTAHIRSPGVYFGFGEERPFYVESNMQLFAARVKHNLTFFYLNYALVTAALFLLTLLISPSAIIGIGLLGLAWASVIKATQSGSVTLKGITISQKQASIGMLGLSVMVLFYILKNVFWWTLSTSGICVALHVFFRDASLHKDEEDKVQMSGDLGEDASFLNSTLEEGAGGIAVPDAI